MTTNEKAPGVSDYSKGLTTDTNDLNFATGQRNSKAIATQIAMFAMAGRAVHQLADGSYFVTRFGMARHCADFTELQSFAHELGVPHE